MFFKKKDKLDENTIVLYAITVAQIFQDAEDKFGATPANKVQSILENIKKGVLKGGNINPDDESLQHLGIMCTALALDESGFMAGLRSRVSKGDRTVSQDDIQKALNLVMKSVQEFVKATNKKS
jgi:hypothetical protein